MSLIGTAVTALMAAMPRPDREKAQDDKDEIARLTRRIDALNRSQARLIEYVASLEAERAGLRHEVGLLRRRSPPQSPPPQQAPPPTPFVDQYREMCNCVPSRSQMFTQAQQCAQAQHAAQQQGSLAQWALHQQYAQQLQALE
jgi:hypothetical protein